MENIKAFGQWDTEVIVGNPFKQQGIQKIFLADPKVALILDTTNSVIGFVTQRIAASEKFMLPKANRSAEEKKAAEYYAVYSPMDEWVIKDEGYEPAAGSEVWSLVRGLIPALNQKLSKEEIKAQIKRDELQSIRDAVKENESEFPYKSFPLSQTKMIQHAAYLAKLDPIQYIKTSLPAHRIAISLRLFGIETEESIS